jgi:hypothetical protein
LIDTLNADTINVQSDERTQTRLAPTPVRPGDANTPGTPRNFEESAQRRVPEIYLGVATVIQGITIGVLGQSVYNYGLVWPPDWMTWTLIISSLMVALIYWLEFVMGYLYLYRLILLTAADHLIVTLVYFAMGVCQIAAYNLVKTPTLWFGAISLLVFIAALYSAYLGRVLRRSRLRQDPLSTQIESEHNKLTLGLSFTFGLLLLCTWLVNRWQFLVYATPLIALLILADLVRDFNKRQQIAGRTDAPDAGE